MRAEHFKHFAILWEVSHFQYGSNYSFSNQLNLYSVIINNVFSCKYLCYQYHYVHTCDGVKTDGVKMKFYIFLKWRCSFIYSLPIFYALK